ncbi:hypothetical protein ACO0OE_003777 [Hanseniaspora uvarum]
MKLSISLIFALSYACLITSKIHNLNFNVSWVDTSPEGEYIKKQIGVNGQWPPPEIHVDKYDRIVLSVTNSLSPLDNPDQAEFANTSLHFHGLFHNITKVENEQSIQNDGSEMVTGYGIPYNETLVYNFTVDDQIGTYWYHAHTGAQYIDGLRAPLIVHDREKEKEWEITSDRVITVSEIYKKNYFNVIKKFLSRYNPTGAEPIPDGFLFNNGANGTIELDYNSKNLLRFINVGGFVSQFIYSPRLEFQVVEIDGVYVEPFTTNLFEIGTAQRVAVVVHGLSEEEFNKEINSGNYYEDQFPIYQIIAKSMLDVIPEGLELIKKHRFLFPGQDRNTQLKEPEQEIDSDELIFDDFEIKPLGSIKRYDVPDKQIELVVKMENLGDGVNYAFFNDITYTPPKIPTLYTVYSSPDEHIFNSEIYGSNTNAFVIKHNDVVEIVLNNDDDNKHNFHFHGHNFQIIERGEPDAGHYNSSESFDKEKKYKTDYPMIRDTVFVEANSYIVLRFVANNPGVWFFHCHIDFHLEQGLAAVFIEAPDLIKKYDKEISTSMKKIAEKHNYVLEGNAAGNSNDWLSLNGENIQSKPLPNGFTIKGYVALFISTFMCLYGVYSIIDFGLYVDNDENNEETKLHYSKMLTELESLVK